MLRAQVLGEGLNDCFLSIKSLSDRSTRGIAPIKLNRGLSVVMWFCVFVTGTVVFLFLLFECQLWGIIRLIISVTFHKCQRPSALIYLITGMLFTFIPLNIFVHFDFRVIFCECKSLVPWCAQFG